MKLIKRRENDESVYICIDCCDVACLGLGVNPKCPNGFGKMYKSDRGFKKIRPVKFDEG